MYLHNKELTAVLNISKTVKLVFVDVFTHLLHSCETLSNRLGTSRRKQRHVRSGAIN